MALASLAAVLAGLGFSLSEFRRRRGDVPAASGEGRATWQTLLAVTPLPELLSARWVNGGVQRRLEQARVPMDAVEFAALRWLLVMGACGLGGGMVVSRSWDLLGIFLGLVLLAFAWWGPHIWLDWQVDTRQRELELALPNLLDRLTLCLEAGLSFELALERTSPRFPGQLGEDLRRLVRQLARGYRRSDALDDLTRRNASSDLRAFVAAVKQADRLGTTLVRTLRLQTNLLRSRRRRRAQQASQRLPILIIFPLVFFFLPALMIIYLAPPILHLLSVR